jgi:hypothetical protein
MVEPSIVRGTAGVSAKMNFLWFLGYGREIGNREQQAEPCCAQMCTHVHHDERSAKLVAVSGNAEIDNLY